jgi:hypothetical protein
VTGPNDDEELGHGGVEVPTEDIDTVPQPDDEDVDADVPDAGLPGSVAGGDGGGSDGAV